MPRENSRYRWFVVGVFFFFMLLHQTDKLMIGSLQVQISEDFGINNTQWGLVNSGALIVATVLYPLWGYLYDRYSRTKLLSLASLVWGITTWFNAIVKTFGGFLATRASTGIDDSSYPGIFTLVADYFGPSLRGKIYGILQLAQPIGYLFHHNKKALAIVTDLGYVSKQIIDLVRGADTLIWESNHDVEMLRMGSYPWNIKRRILSDIGHLSNEDAGEALTEVLQGRGEQVYLAHLSKENNLKELAFLTVKEILNDAGLQVGSDAHLLETFDDRPTPLREVQETRKWAFV